MKTTIKIVAGASLVAALGVATYVLVVPSAPPLTAFETTPWQNPIISESLWRVRITVENAPSGLYVRKDLDPNQRYLMKAKGYGDAFTMRLTRDQRKPEYLAAPTTPNALTITDTSKLELLFYSDKPGIYSVQKVDIQPCPTCRIEDDVKARIRAEIPGIDALGPFQKAEALLHWSANVADYTPNSKLIPNDFEKWPIEKHLFEFFDKDVGGVSCGGMAVFTTKVMRLFDLNAFTINFGIPNTKLTHVSTIIEIDDYFYLYDPTFAGSYSSQGEPVDFISAYSRLINGQGSSLQFLSTTLEKRDFIAPGPVLALLVCEERFKTASNMLRCRMGKKTYASIFKASQGELWRAGGVPIDDLTMVRLLGKGVFSVGEGSKPETRAKFIDRLKALDVPFHKL